MFAEAVDPASPFWTLDGDPWRRRVGGALGVPRRTARKLALDVPVAVRDKLRTRLGR